MKKLYPCPALERNELHRDAIAKRNDLINVEQIRVLVEKNASSTRICSADHQSNLYRFVYRISD